MEGAAKRNTEIGIGRVHDLLMGLLEYLDAVAKDTGLSYYLAYGTAIGALRHQDFIPWDIDADVLVWRDQYDELVDALRSRLPDEMMLLTPADRDYEYLFARIGLRGFEHIRVHLDLFPLERAPSGRLGRRVYAVLTWTTRKLYLVKQVSPRSRTHYGKRKRWGARAGKLLLAPIPRRAISGFFFAFTRWFAARSNGHVVANSCGSYGMREFFRGAWFREGRAAQFRNRELTVPSECEVMLESIYGDYMTPVAYAEQQRLVEHIEDHYVGPLRSNGLI